MPESLWKSLEPARFFVIPDDFNAPAGNLAIRNLMGARRLVDPDSVKQFERTEEQATQWLEGKVGKMLEGVRGWIDNVADRLTGATADPIGALRESVDRTSHLASIAVQKTSRTTPPKDVKSLQTSAERLRQIAAKLDAAAIQASPPI